MRERLCRLLRSCDSGKSGHPLSLTCVPCDVSHAAKLTMHPISNIYREVEKRNCCKAHACELADVLDDAAQAAAGSALHNAHGPNNDVVCDAAAQCIKAPPL